MNLFQEFMDRVVISFLAMTEARHCDPPRRRSNPGIGFGNLDRFVLPLVVLAMTDFHFKLSPYNHHMKDKTGYIYILASAKNGTLYVGVTSHLAGRIWQHKNHVNKRSFTDRYDCALLVYYEIHENIESAIEREKQIKGGNRNKKILLIEKDNPDWRDLYDDIV